METISKEKIAVISAEDISVDGNQLVIRFKGSTYSFELNKLSKRLKKGTPAQLQHYILSPSGYGIHWTDLDEDISIHGLLKDANKKNK